MTALMHAASSVGTVALIVGFVAAGVCVALGFDRGEE